MLTLSFLQLFENMATKEEIAQNEQFLLSSPCFQLYSIIVLSFNPFPHIDDFRRLFSRRLFENIVTKEEIAQNEQFLLLTQCFPLLVIGYPFNYGDLLLHVGKD